MVVGIAKRFTALYGCYLPDRGARDQKLSASLTSGISLVLHTEVRGLDVKLCPLSLVGGTILSIGQQPPARETLFSASWMSNERARSSFAGGSA